MQGKLSIVATPIGNLEDITLRALRILRSADLVAAEDTRHTAKLLTHYDIRTRTTSLHEHNEREKVPALVARLVTAQIRGTQEHGMIATAKHFPGHGDTSVDSHLALPVVNRTEEAIVAHKETAHYTKWRDAVAPMMAEPRSSEKFINVFPDDMVWCGESI